MLLVGAANTAPALQRGAQLSTDSTGLVLTETGAVTLPAGIQVREVVVFEGGRVVFWTDTALWDWHETRATPLRICRNQRLHIESAAWRHSDHRLVVVDTAAGHAVLLDLADGCRTAKTVLLTRELREAARAGSGLTISESSILALRSVRGRAPQLIVLSLQTGEQRIISIEAKNLRIAEGGSYTPLAEGAGLLLTEAAYPFRTIRVSPSGKAQVLLDPANQLPSTMQAVLVRGWIALHLLRTPRWSLVGLADIASDRRLFVVLDPTGVVVRRTELDIAMGFLAVDDIRQTMVAVRDALRLAVRHPETLPAFLDVIAVSERYLAVQQFDGDDNREWIVVDTNLTVHGRFKTDRSVYLYAGADGQLWGIDYRVVGKEELVSWRLSH